jgi:dipeptidyl aminopeptidase/acylaminoacyl peptidase
VETIMTKERHSPGAGPRGAWGGVVRAAVLAGSIACSFASVHAQAPEGGARPVDDPAFPLLPRAVIFGNPDRAAAQLSEDARHISWLAPVDGVLNVWVAPVDDLAKARPITKDAYRGIRQYFWAATHRHILYLQDEGGDENWRVHCVDVETGAMRDLTPRDVIPGPDGKPLLRPDGRPQRPTALLLNVSDNHPDEIVVGLNDRNPQYHDVYRVNIRTGERALLLANDQWSSVLTDHEYQVRFASRTTDEGGTEWHRYDARSGAFALDQSVGSEDDFTTKPVGFSADGGMLYLFDSRGRDTGALFERDLATGASRLLAEHPKADGATVLTHPTTKRVQAVAFNHERVQWTLIDPALREDWEHLQKASLGEISVLSRSLDDRTWLVAFSQDRAPTTVFLYRRPVEGQGGRSHRFLFSYRPALEGLPLARMHPVAIRARDGLELVSYLSLPGNKDSDGDARPDDGPIPMVLLVHGGPWSRDAWGYNGSHQWLANRGYAVLSVNFRGSIGFGKSFTNAGDRQWAAKMHDDLLDAVAWAVKVRVAREDKVAIMGGSYGGYATLVGLTFTPETFACGVSIVGPSNLVTLLESIPPYWAPAVRKFITRVGDHTTSEGREFLASRSPLTFVERIQRPLLIGQGANDPRVLQSESDQIVGAMQERGIPVTYVLFPDEGHGFARPTNNMAFNAVAEAFLAQHLGGRFEPIGDALKASSAEVRAGAKLVPGLAGAQRPREGLGVREAQSAPAPRR